MTLWIDGRSVDAQDFGEIEKLIPKRPDLVEVLRFLKFWYSKDTSWDVLTSGSTGVPKSVSISRAQMLASARLSIKYFNFSPQTDGLLLGISVRFVGGFMVLVRAFLLGIDVWLEPASSRPFSGSGVDFGNKRWFLSMAPLQLDFMTSQPQIVLASKNWKGILFGGSALTKSQMAALSVFHCPVYHSYGMTETVSHIGIARVNGSEKDPVSVFQVLDGIQVRTNENQCLEIKGEPTGNMWIHTRDRAEILSKDRFRILGRLDRVINSGGLKADPDWIKACILDLNPDLDDSFEIIGIPDELLGQRIILVFESQSEKLNQLNWTDLFIKLGQHMDPRLVPKSVVSIPQIPLLENFKVDYPMVQNWVLDRVK